MAAMTEVLVANTAGHRPVAPWALPHLIGVAVVEDFDLRTTYSITATSEEYYSYIK